MGLSKHNGKVVFMASTDVWGELAARSLSPKKKGANLVQYLMKGFVGARISSTVG